MKTIIITNKPGQLGNRLFVFAHFIALAMEKDFTIYDPSFDEYANYFKAFENRRILYSKVPIKKKVLFSNSFEYKCMFQLFRALKFLKSPFHSTILIDWDQKIDLLTYDFERTHKYVFAFGWQFRSEVLIKKYANEIRTLFEPNEELRNTLDSYLSKIDKKGRKLVGVHIRRGDYKTFENGKFYYSNEQYLDVMKNLETSLGSNVIFLICSNEKIDSNYFKKNNMDHVEGPGQELLDMYALANCDHIIGPPSTFSMWASFYGKVPLYMIKNLNKKIELSDFEITYS